MFTSYLDYTKDVSLTKYGADTVGQYISQASQEQVQAIDRASRAIGQGFCRMSQQLSTIDSKLGFLNRNVELLVQQQRMSNVLLQNIAELLRVPDSEKERQHSIELGIKFFVNGSKDPELYADALEMLLKAEQMMRQDYFVLHRIGCIYLHVPQHLDPVKALDYFTRAAKYASIEADPQAVRLASILTQGRDAPNSEVAESPEAIRSLAAESYEEAAFAAYVLGKSDEAARLQARAVSLMPLGRLRFVLSKYQIRSGQREEAIKNINQALVDAPLLSAAVFREVDLFNEPEIVMAVEAHGQTYQDVCDVLDAEQPIFTHILLDCTTNYRREVSRLHADNAGRPLSPANKSLLLRYDAGLKLLNSMVGKSLFDNALAVAKLLEVERTASADVLALYKERLESVSEQNPDLRQKEVAKRLADVFRCKEEHKAWGDLISRLNGFVEFSYKATAGNFGENERAILGLYGQYIKEAQAKRRASQAKEHRESEPLPQREQKIKVATVIDALALVAAADKRVSTTEQAFIVEAAAAFGLGDPKDHLMELVRQAVAGIQAEGVSVFANAVRDRLLPYRGTQVLENVLKAMADLAQRDGAVHENEKRVTDWFRQQLGGGVP